MNSLWHYDQTLFRDVNIGWHSSWLDPFFLILSTSGLGWVQISVLLLILILQVSRRADRGFRAIKEMVGRPAFIFAVIYGWAITGIFDLICKQLVPRERPSDLTWSMPQEQVSWRSFASGHTATSFGIAFSVLFLTWNTKHRRWGIVAITWAGLVGLSRLYRGVHWPTDVLSGFCVGLAGASVLMLILPKPQTEARTER